MEWVELHKTIEYFDELVGELNLSVPPNSGVGVQFKIVREFLTDQESLLSDDLIDKWNNNAEFKRFYDAVIVVFRLTRAVVALKNQPRKILKNILAVVLAGSITQDSSPCQAKDFFYELDLAYKLLFIGFSVTLREPDIVITGNGLSCEIGIACKYPSSVKQVHAHISKGYRQLTGQNLSGIVALGMDLIMFRKVFNSSPHYLDFRQNPKQPLTIAQDFLKREMAILITERPEKYPSESPLDGALLSLNCWGAYGEPARFTEVNAWTFQCMPENPLRNDICIINKHVHGASQNM